MGTPDCQVQMMWGWPNGCTEWPTKALPVMVRWRLLWWGTMPSPDWSWVCLDHRGGSVGLREGLFCSKGCHREVIVCRRPWCREELIPHPSETSPMLIWQYCKYKLNVKFTQQVQWVLWHNPGGLSWAVGSSFLSWHLGSHGSECWMHMKGQACVADKEETPVIDAERGGRTINREREV